MPLLEHTLRPPDADAPPLVMRVSVQNRTLRFVLTFDNQPKGLWRTDMPQALAEELAILESKLKSPVNVSVIPPDLPMPSAIIATVVTEQPQHGPRDRNTLQPHHDIHGNRFQQHPDNRTKVSR